MSGSVSCTFKYRYDMAIKNGDILDERKRFPESCGLVVKCGGGGEDFRRSDVAGMS